MEGDVGSYKKKRGGQMLVIKKGKKEIKNRVKGYCAVP